MAESEDELKNLLMRVEEESEKAGLKLNIKKAKIKASSSVTLEVEGEKVEDFLFLGSKITADGDWGHRQESRSSADKCQADEPTGITQLSWQ